jgi:spermidine synthase
MESADFTVLPYHNNIPTLGEWGWCLGMRKEVVSNEMLKTKVMEIEQPPPPYQIPEQRRCHFNGKF